MFMAVVMAVVLVVLAIVILSRRGPISKADGADIDPAATEARRSNRALPTIAVEIAADAGVRDPGGAQAIAPTHIAGPKCETCSAQNCAPATSGCDQIDSATDRALCEDLYACFTDPANDCVNEGDAVKCWCGTNPTTCLTEHSGTTSANGPCLDKILAGAKSADPATIRERFLDPAFPLGRAASLTGCRGAFCPSECKVR